MIFDPLKILSICKWLCRAVQYRDLETVTRTIISRAYYSTFLHAREYLKEKENVVFTNTRKDHILVENELKRRIDRTLGSAVRTLREYRQISDYDLNSPAVICTRSGAWWLLNFDKNDQQESVRLAEFVTGNLPRS